MTTVTPHYLLCERILSQDSYPSIRCTPSFDPQILVEKVRLILGWLRYVCDWNLSNDCGGDRFTDPRVQPMTWVHFTYCLPSWVVWVPFIRMVVDWVEELFWPQLLWLRPHLKNLGFLVEKMSWEKRQITTTTTRTTANAEVRTNKWNYLSTFWILCVLLPISFSWMKDDFRGPESLPVYGVSLIW